MDELEKEYKRGLALRDAGDIDGCIKSLEKASRAPKLRLRVHMADRSPLSRARHAARVSGMARTGRAGVGAQRRRRHTDCSSSWPTRSRKSGRCARALAVCLELQAEAGDYEDIAERIDRLAKVQA